MAATMQQGGDGRREDARLALPCPPIDTDGLAPGTHLVTRRRGYDHHGIYVGAGRVVHYGGLARSWRRGPVEEVSLEHFAAGRPVRVKPAAGTRYGSAEIIARARSRLGEDRYRIASNNCEHFCEWCIHGVARSEQIERLLAMLRRCLPLARRFAPPASRSSESLAA